MHQRPRDHQALRHAARVAIYLFVFAIAQPEFFEQPVGERFAGLARHAVIGRMERQDLAHFQAAVEIALLRDNGDALFDSDGITRDVGFHDRRRAFRRDDSGCEYADGGGLARTIRAQQAEDLTARDFE